MNPPPDFRPHALAPDATTLDPDHPVNANLRDRGIGLVPNRVSIDLERGCATLAPAALVAFVCVPLGWHVIDDGRRTLLLDPGGAVQVNLSRIATPSDGVVGVLDAIEAEARASYPSPEFMRISEGRISALGVRGIADGGEPIEQYHLLLPVPGAEAVVRARVTSTPARSPQACNLAQLILECIEFPRDSA